MKLTHIVTLLLLLPFSAENANAENADFPLRNKREFTTACESSSDPSLSRLPDDSHKIVCDCVYDAFAEHRRNNKIKFDDWAEHLIAIIKNEKIEKNRDETTNYFNLRKAKRVAVYGLTTNVLHNCVSAKVPMRQLH